MEFDLSWILLGLPLAFILGWVASRMDLRQLRLENRQTPKAYFKGLNYLLNEQQDQAIDAFIEAVQHDPDTSDLHFALGNLFRRRGEYERAVRVHEHLLNRGDLPATDRERAVSLYLAVRDQFRYDPYRIDLSPEGMRASSVIAQGSGWCVPKAALMAAACRAAGLHARLGYADVRNHLSTERLRQTMQTDVFIWHGYADLWLDGRWVKATPAFNIELCNKFGLLPLDFDGRSDSIYHPFDQSGNRHMEYVQQRGMFDDMPLAQITADFEVVC